MVVLDVTVSFLGRFLVEEDGTLIDEDLLPSTSAEELTALQALYQSKQSEWSPALETLSATLASMYKLTPQDIIVNSINQPELIPEPEDT